ncbi:helix-turn-helix transcriptional regulator [Aeromonas rivipollensis]|uniref:helix-turn-helix transcriptional regulator n=1 Tax=Aeromonas rivipollensis TaxID=948519 RepID=UPI00338D68EC
MNHLLIIRPSQLARELGVSMTTLWRWRHQGVFPQPILLGPRLVGWERSVINQWLESKKKMEMSL